MNEFCVNTNKWYDSVGEELSDVFDLSTSKGREQAATHNQMRREQEGKARYQNGQHNYAIYK